MTDELIDDRVYRLDLGMVNAYLVDDGEVTLVDAGTPGSVGTLREELGRAGYAEADIDRVLLTHFDLDHVGGLAALETDASIHAMEPDASYTDGSASPPLANHKGLLQRLLGFWLSSPDRPVEPIDDGDSIGQFAAVHTPGHTPGHTVYLHESLPVALLGDLVRETDGRLETPPWFINYDTAENAASVRGLAGREPAFDVAAMGHGEPIRENGDGALRALTSRLS